MVSGRGQVGPKSVGSRGAENAKNPDKNSLKRTDTEKAAENAHPEPQKINGRSYRNGGEAAPPLVASTSTASAEWG
jgi:hypothetical protein